MEEKRREITFRANALRLEEIFKQVAERLIADDWQKRTAADGSWFFVLGREAFDAAEGTTGLCSIDYAEGLGEPFTSQRKGLRKRLAGSTGAPLESARRAALQAGLPLATLDQLEATCRVRGPETLTRTDLDGILTDGESLTWPQLQARVRAFCDFLDLIAGDAHHPEHRLAEGDIAKIFLDEFARRLPKMVARASKLSEMQFEDPRLEEASRCHLAGFYNAAAVLAVSALEGTLREGVGGVAADGRELSLLELVNAASRKGALSTGSGLVEAAHQARVTRNKIVHGGDVSPSESEAVLDRVRLVLEHLRRVV